MTILKKIVDGDKIIGYILDDDGFETVLLSRCLYIQLYIEPLIAAGYKFYNYNPDDIEDSTGKKISELPAVDKSVMTEDDQFALEEMAMNALTDVECARYYVYKNDSIVQFKEPSEVTITTREALIAYLEEVEHSYQHSGYCTDNVPLNSFVAKDVLFSLDEIKRDPEVRRLYTICQRRHIFKDIVAYKRVVKFLNDEGVLQTMTPTYIEFMAGYYAWGVDGVKDDCVKVTTRQAVDGYFDRYTDTVEAGNYLSNRYDEFVLWDSKCTAHFMNTSVDMSNIASFDREPIALSPDRLFELKRSEGNWGSRFRVIRASVANVNDRCYYEFLTEEGYPYQIRLTHNRQVIFSGTYVVDSMGNFGIRSIIPDITLSLNEVRNEDDYYFWNLAIIKGQSICKSRSKEVPVGSTYEMLRKEGISPKAAIRMMAHDIKYVDYSSNTGYVNAEGKRADYFRAFEYYTRPIPARILDHFGVSDDYEDTDDFLAQAIDPEAVVEEGGKKKLSAQQKAINIMMGNDSEIAVRDYYDNLEFVRACLNGEVTINQFGDGRREDVGATSYQAAKIILTAMYASKDKCQTVYDKEDFIARFEEQQAINIDGVFRYRDAAYRGYICDLSACREKRAKNSWAWCYCTKVFRELSNKEIKDQRPYLMELVTVSDNVIRNALTNCVINAIDKSHPDLVRNVINMQAGYFAARIFFAILSGQIGQKHLVGTNYEITITVYDENKITIKIPSNLYLQVKQYPVSQNMYYITLYDYCQFEYGDNGAFSLFLVNADVDPWHIVPKKGYTIPTYNFMVNYNTGDVLSRLLGDNYMSAVTALAAKPVFALSRLDPDSFLPGGMDQLYADDNTYDADTIDIFLDESMDESVKHYKDRWVFKRKAARSEGLKILQIPLKQDIVYKQIAKYFCVENPDQDIVYDNNLNDDNKCLYTVQKGSLTSDIVMSNMSIGAKEITRRQFNAYEFQFEEVYTWSGILRGTFIPALTYYMHGGAMTVFTPGQEDSIIIFSQITADDLNRLADSGMLLKLGENKYFAKAYNGDFVLEV